MGYVELFSTFRLVICLSDNYQGEKISKTYMIDPVNGKRLEAKVRMIFSRIEVDEILQGKTFSQEQQLKIFDNVMEFSIEKKRQLIIENAVRLMFEQYSIQDGKEKYIPADKKDEAFYFLANHVAHLIVQPLERLRQT